MLAIVGLITILLVLASIMTKKLSTMSALIAIPIVACLFLGQGSDLGKYMLAGIHFCSFIFYYSRRCRRI